MPEHDLLLQLNKSVNDLCEIIGELRSDQKATANEVKGLRNDLSTVCTEVDNLKKERDMVFGGSKVIIAVSGFVSAGISLMIAGLAYLRGHV